MNGEFSSIAGQPTLSAFSLSLVWTNNAGSATTLSTRPAAAPAAGRVLVGTVGLPTGMQSMLWQPSRSGFALATPKLGEPQEKPPGNE